MHYKDVSILILIPFNFCWTKSDKKKINTFYFAVPLYGMFSQNGIYLWWPKVDHVNVKSYLIQFQSNEPTNFSDHVIGTTKIIDEYQTWSEISQHLTKVAAVTNVYEVSDDELVATIQDNRKNGTHSAKSITELRVGGNVTGILIPNTSNIIARILVPVYDEDGELFQDLRFVEWKRVSFNYKFNVFLFEFCFKWHLFYADC